ncbi:helix-turn-helix domain-containing protein [Dickeya fangzhongdai]|uniref:helix-turn-helix domain-containing protein n=1 Tax=Dickeya fangzhongdai TaxID=1778540 RepID=UPI003B967DB1
MCFFSTEPARQHATSAWLQQSCHPACRSILPSSTLGNALIRPWPKGELLIAEALGVPAYEIWPSRYFDEQGQFIPRTPRSRLRYTQEKYPPADN